MFFSGKLSFSLFFWDFSGKTPAGLSKQKSTLTEEQLRKVVFYFKGFDFWYCYLTLNKIFWILSENYKQGCQNCILCVEMNKFRKNIFFWKKLSVSISFRLLRKKNLDIQRKKCQDCPNWIWSVRWQNLKKNVFFWCSYKCTQLFGQWWKHIPNFGKKVSSEFSKLPCTCPNKRFERSDSLSKLSIWNFFPEFERKISSSVIKN